MLCRASLQALLLMQSACFIVSQVQLELNSSVIASKRSFACQNEEIVYRCVANSTTMDTFETIWRWNNSFVKNFISTERIGVNNTCISDESLRFLHSTLVYTAPTTCISLLIVTPSLPDYDDISVPIECQVHVIADGIGLQKNLTRTLHHMHNTISGVPEWGNSAEENVILSCDSYSTSNYTLFLLNISWPGITNEQDMDFKFYTLTLQIIGENNVMIHNFTGETIATYYERIMFQESPEAANNLTAKIAVSAINKCENVATLHPPESSSLNKDSCSNYILTPPAPHPTEPYNNNNYCNCSGNGNSDSSSKPSTYNYVMYAIIVSLAAGVVIFHHICHIW